MNDVENLIKRAHTLLDRLECLLPASPSLPDMATATAFRWRVRGQSRQLIKVTATATIRLSDLQCIDRQKQAIVRNTQQFLQGLPANHALLWGPRGTGKSSLIKALLNEYRDAGLKMIEVDKNHMVDLPDIIDLLHDQPGRYIVYCDDLSFESNDPGYKAIKVVIDGSISQTPDNLLIYATSNRRHLVPEYMQENLQSEMLEGELHLSESIEEKISLSERFGMWLAFHSFNQEAYLQIVDYWMSKMNKAALHNREEMHKAALKWALEHGSRSGRSAWQFTRDWTGRHGLTN
ncbi:MAG TPA: ATP-binding protein [Gammaproteobacteria bacterium]|nr:ATP-binding protein [Gammaproteobacteria bacterium]